MICGRISKTSWQTTNGQEQETDSDAKLIEVRGGLIEEIWGHESEAIGGQEPIMDARGQEGVSGGMSLVLPGSGRPTL